MGLIRLLGTLLVTVSAALLVAPGAAAEPPLRLPGQVTDHAGALSASGRATVQQAIDRLYTDRRVRLWVVYVDDFSGQTADSWARSTASSSDLGGRDALLAIGVTDRGYAFLASQGVSGLTQGRVDELRRSEIEPALHRGDWTGAAVAAATGLAAAGRTAWVPPLIALAVVGLAGVVLLIVVRYLRRRRRAAALAAARRVDLTDPDALADVPLAALDDLSRLEVVAVDNAVRTSANELALAVDEFGDQRTQPFSRAIENAHAALTQAFTVRQQLDDAIPETPAQRRELLAGAIVAAARADRELEVQREAFEQLRDLVLGAPARLDVLTQRLIELTARIPASAQHLESLHTEFDPAALTPVSGNITDAQDRVSFADRNITHARQLAGHPITGGQSELVDAVRAAEAGLGQAEALLDAVDSAAADIRHAVAALPAAIADVEAGINRAAGQLRGGSGRHTRDLTRARDAAVRAVATARRSTDPLGAFTRLTRVDADLNGLVDTVAEERAATERLARALKQALFTAQSRVRAVSDYIDTRRGSVGPEARTRLAEAHRRLAAAEDERSRDAASALADANAAATLAASAQSLAQSDVHAAQRSYYGRYGGDDSGAMLGGIIIGNMMGRGSGGWSPTSFGGSGSSGGGFFGGGGRF
ncbi:MAG TPA: TPM domain-containing protein [Mycobacterium sp.]|nr:TPM domain-containing protein [Mycobacterium sp.]